VLFFDTTVHHIQHTMSMSGNGVSTINKHEVWWGDYVQVS